jgi:hypothetical protein
MSIQETLLQKFLSLEKKVDIVDGDVKYIRKNLFGNGSPGIDEKVRLNTRFREDVRKLIWIFAAAFLAQIGFFITILLKQ